MPNRFDLRVLFAIAIFFTAVILVKSGYLFPSTATIADNGQRPIHPERLTGDYDPIDTMGEFLGQSFASQEVPLAQQPVRKQAKVLGESSDPSAKRIEVDLSNQRLYAFEGDKKVYDFLVSTGKWNRTPTGTFHIWGKFRYTKMEGGNKAAHTYYYLPNVPFVMFFSNDDVPAARGFSLHGTYWHSNFGHPMSHGCVNMKTEEVAMLYDWATPSLPDAKTRSVRASDDNPGTPVVIYGETPKE